MKEIRSLRLTRGSDFIDGFMSGERFLPETRDGDELQDDEQHVLGSILCNLHSLKLCSGFLVR